MSEGIKPYSSPSEFPEENLENTEQQYAAEPENNNRRFLTERDINNLLAAGESLIRQFEADFPEDLPKVIVLPDTSARPFAYFFEPIMAELAKKRGCEKPVFVFFKTGRHISQKVSEYESHELTLRIMKEKSGLEEVVNLAKIDLEHRIKMLPVYTKNTKELRSIYDQLIAEQEEVIEDCNYLIEDEKFDEDRPDVIKGYLEEIEEARNLIDGMKRQLNPEYLELSTGLENIESLMRSAFEHRAKFRERMAARVQKIKSMIGPDFKKSDVAIIDEFINEGFSIKQIRDAFGDDEIAAYTLLSTNDSSYYEEGMDYRENPLRGETGPIKVGMQDPAFALGKTSSRGFDFLDKIKETDDKSAIGVTKKDENGALLTEPLYSKRLPEQDRNRVAMEGLRTELRAVGQQLRDKLFADGQMLSEE